MAFGYTGKVLRVDLSAQKISIDEMPENSYRTYFGGEAFIGYTLLKELKPGVDPLGPENKLIFAAGPLTGVPVGGCGRHCVGAKSPLTGGFGSGEAGGWWGAELKMAGFDAVIIEGQAAAPVYLFIEDGKAEIKNAQHLWGLKALECQEAIRQELNDNLVRVALIGPAGENLVRFACISNDLDAFAGRTGLGAVMGAKKLKAVACRGHVPVPVASPEKVKEIGTWVKDHVPGFSQRLRDLGTANLVNPLYSMGALPIRNYQTGIIEGAANLSGEALKENYLTRRRSCFACPVQCKREAKLDTPYQVNPRYGGPEYETIAAFGSNCGITNLAATCKAHEVSAAFGVDSISCGGAISFAMECFEKGILTRRDTDGLDLTFGNTEAMLAMIERIALRQGLGDTLAEGVARAAQKIGKGADAFNITIKGQELPLHEPRLKPGMGVGFSMSPTGADHCHNIHDTAYAGMTPMLEDINALGVFEPVPVNDISPAKIRILIHASHFQHFVNSAVCCYFVMIPGQVGVNRLAELVRAVTGWSTSAYEIIKVGERSENLARAFNVREGLTASNDSMPDRFFTPPAAGPLKEKPLSREQFQNALQTYYSIADWPEGRPAKGKLWELGLGWVVPEIYG